MSWCCICPYFSWKLITNNVLVSMRLSLLFLGFWVDIWYLPFLTQTHNSYGGYFSVSCQISGEPSKLKLWYFNCLAGRSWTNKTIKSYYLKCWQLNPKIYLRTSLTSDLTVLRLLNHCKSNTVRRTFYPPPPRMKSVITVLIGPPSHVSPLSMSPIGCGIASGQQQRSDWLGQEGSPPITVGCKTYLHLNRYLKWLLS